LEGEFFSTFFEGGGGFWFELVFGFTGETESVTFGWDPEVGRSSIKNNFELLVIRSNSDGSEILSSHIVGDGNIAFSSSEGGV